MDAFKAEDIKRLGHGDFVRVLGEYSGIVYRRTPDEQGRIRGRKQAEYIVTCDTHSGTRNRYANTLKLAVSMAEDTSLWCPACRDAWVAAHEGR